MNKKTNCNVLCNTPKQSFPNFSIYLFQIFFLLFIQNTVFSQALYDVKGYINDEASGEALVYANVIIEGTSIGATTNNRGYFVIVDAPKDTLNLIVSYMGYTTQKIKLNNLNGQTSLLKINLSSKVLESQEVVVTAEDYKIWKTADNVSQITISPKQISALPRIGEVDIFRSLQLLPGISGISDGSAGLYVRGGTPDQNLILLDGMTVYHVDHFFGFFSAFNSDAIKDVQVYKGGYPSNFGGRLSSVVDLTGKTGNVNDFKLSVGANLLSVNGVAEIPLWNKGSVLLSARRSFADFIESPTYNSIYSFLTGGDSPTNTQGVAKGKNQVTQTVLPSFYFYDFNGKVSYPVTDDDFISISYYNGGDHLDESQDPQTVSLYNNTTSATKQVTDLTEWGNTGTSIKWDRRWNDRLFSNMILAYSNYKSSNILERSFNQNIETDTTAFTSNSYKSFQDNNIKDLTFKLDNNWSLHPQHKLGFGIQVTGISTKYNMIINDSLNIVNRDDQTFYPALYLQDKWQALPFLDFTVGLRNTYYDLTSSFYWEPRFSFNYKFYEGLKLKGAWSHNYQFINQVTNEDVLEGSRDFWILADNTLQPGFSEHFILGLDYETNDYLFSVEGYYKNFENLMEFSQRIRRNPREFSADASNYVANFFTGTGFAKGIEFLAQKKFGAFNGWVSYTIGKVEYTFPAIDNGDPFPATQDRTNEVKLVGSYSLGKWSFSSTWVYATGQPYTSPESQYFITLLNGDTESYIHVSEKNSYRLPDYHRLDISASYKFANKSLDGEIGVSVFNLYNNQNIWYKKYDLEVSPIVITDVTMLGITPSVFIKLNF